MDIMDQKIVKLTTNGQKVLDPDEFKELIIIAAQSEDNLKYCYKKLMETLETKHGEVRFSTFLIIEQLFRRSELFRVLLLEDFNDFIELVIGSAKRKLPAPHDVSKLLKFKSLQTIQKWHQEFGPKHNKIIIAYNYLKNKLKVDFNDAEIRFENEIRRARQEEERKNHLLNFKLNTVKAEMDENCDEISRITIEMDNCSNLIIPKPINLFEEEILTNISSNISSNEHNSSPNNQKDQQNSDYDDVSDNDHDSNLREHGVLTGDFSVTINLNDVALNGKSQVEKTEDNEHLIENLRDLYSLAKQRFYPMIKRWVTFASSSNDTNLLKKTLDMKEMLKKEMDKYEDLQFGKKRKHSSSESSDNDTDDSDFEEVEEGKDGYEEEVVAPPVIPPSKTRNLNDNLPSSSSSSSSFVLHGSKSNENNKTSLESSSTSSSLVESRKEKLLKIAPKIPFDVDLLNWEEGKLQAPTIEISDNGQHRFWQPHDREGDTIELVGGVESLRTRKIEYCGDFEPVKYSCRVPLPNGSLCPRKDRIKCPFHGKIIARDVLGIPTNPEDIEEEIKRKEKEKLEKVPEWQDPEYLKDLKAQIGIDLTITPKGYRGNKKKKLKFSEQFPNLTNIEKKETSRSRIGKKVFKKGSLKRIGQAEHAINLNKYNDKFGDQFNYALNS